MKARSGPDPTKKKCRASPAWVNRKILSLGPSMNGPMGIKEKSVSRQGSSSFKPDALAAEI